VIRVHRVHKVLQVLKVLLEVKVQLAILVSRVLVESLVWVDRRDHQGQVEFKVLLALLVNLEIQAKQASKVVLVQMETLEQQAKLEHLDNKASLATQDLVVIPVLLAILDKWDHKDLLELQVLLAHEVIRVP
jgi:hypothetical protein